MLVLLSVLACAIDPDDSAAAFDTKTNPEPVCLLEGCGGDIEGTWIVRDVCLETTPTVGFDEDCPEATWLIDAWDLEGEYAFEADGDYAVNLVLEDMRWVFWWPASCQDEASCQDMENEYISCDWSAVDGCACEQTGHSSEPDQSRGTWSTRGSDLYIDDGDAATYCVDEEGLRIQWTLTGMPSITVTLTPP